MKCLKEKLKWALQKPQKILPCRALAKGESVHIQGTILEKVILWSINPYI